MGGDGTATPKPAGGLAFAGSSAAGSAAAAETKGSGVDADTEHKQGVPLDRRVVRVGLLPTEDLARFRATSASSDSTAADADGRTASLPVAEASNKDAASKPVPPPPPPPGQGDGLLSLKDVTTAVSSGKWVDVVADLRMTRRAAAPAAGGGAEPPAAPPAPLLHDLVSVEPATVQLPPAATSGGFTLGTHPRGGERLTSVDISSLTFGVSTVNFASTSGYVYPSSCIEGETVTVLRVTDTNPPVQVRWSSGHTYYVHWEDLRWPTAGHAGSGNATTSTASTGGFSFGGSAAARPAGGGFRLGGSPARPTGGFSFGGGAGAQGHRMLQR